MIHETYHTLTGNSSVTCNYVLCVAIDDCYCGLSITECFKVARNFQDYHLLNYFIYYTILYEKIPNINIPTKLSDEVF